MAEGPLPFYGGRRQHALTPAALLALLCAIAVLALLLLVPAVSFAAVPATPQVTGPIPRTDSSIPVGTAEYPGAAASVDLARHGYVEEEYFISGTANVYDYDAGGQGLQVKTPNVPYTTAILVRHPKNPHRFSGRVQLEMSHPQFGVDTQVWAWNHDKFMRDGDAWVRVTTSRGGPALSSVGLAKEYDPIRYATIDYPEDGLNWDVIGQIGKLIKSNDPSSPLAGYPVREMLMSGWSGAGAVVQMWVNDFSRILRMPGGAPIVDGYIVGEPSGYPRINSSAPAIAADDPRQKVIPPGVPVIKLHSHSEPASQRRPDSDAPSDRYRTYEVAGPAHADNATNPDTFPTFLQLKNTSWGATMYPFSCKYPMNSFPFTQQWGASFSALERWVDQGAGSHGRGWSPPHAARLALNPDGSTVKDAFGNEVGGVRSVALDVPTATYYDTNVPNPGDAGFCSNTSVGHEEPFSDALLKQLYPTHHDYVKRVTRRAKQLADDGWLLPEDAKATIAEAKHAQIP
ncbi:MAG TPA: alpha/beta hydrolase domain-containing protein [Conexibacter sp.]